MSDPNNHVQEDLNGYSFAKGKYFDFKRSKYYPINGIGNEMIINITNEDNEIVWSKELVDKVFKYPEQFLIRSTQEDGISKNKVRVKSK